MCHIAQDKMPYIVQGVEEAYYSVPIAEDKQWDDLNIWMGLVKTPWVRRVHLVLTHAQRSR
jgi:hypothetical protein